MQALASKSVRYLQPKFCQVFVTVFGTVQPSMFCCYYVHNKVIHNGSSQENTYNIT